MEDFLSRDIQPNPLERKELPTGRMDDAAFLEERIANLTDELAQREAELVAARDTAMRAAADADNYKKRLEREREEQRKRDEADLVVSFLPALDSLEMALSSAKGAPEPGKLMEGIELTRQQFRDILAKRGLERIETLGKPFDPVTSHALAVEETALAEDGTVLREFLPGYMYKGTLARPARVAVARNVPDRKENPGDVMESR